MSTTDRVNALVVEVRALEGALEMLRRNDRAARAKVVTANENLSHAAQAVMNTEKRVADKYRELERAIAEEAKERVRV